MMNPNASLIQILQNSLINDKPQYKEIVAEDQLDQLQKYTFVKSECEYDCCPISMKTFKEGEKITKLECGHIFDTESIKQWVTTEKASCPICRFKLKCKQVRITRNGEETASVDLSNNNISESQASSVNNVFGANISDHPSMIRDNSYNIIYNGIISHVRNMVQQEQQIAINILSEYISRNNSANSDEQSENTSNAVDESSAAGASAGAAAGADDSITAFNRRLLNEINRTHSNIINYRTAYRMNSYIADSDVALQQAIMESMGANNEVIDSSGNE